MCVALAISLFAGCAHFESIEYSQEISEENPQTVEAFDQFINDIFETEVTENTINLHFTISDPEKYGITDYPVTLGDLSIDAMADSNARLENYLSGLNSFSYTELTLNQQLTYDILENYFKLQLDMADMYLYDELLRPSTGIQAQLPILYEEYSFTSKKDVTAVTAPTEAEINVIDLAFKGGWIMVVLLLLSLMACYIFIQRLMVIRRAGKEDETFMNRIKDYIHEGKVDSALNLCRSTNTPSARMIEKGITRLGRPMNDVLVAIENVGNLEIAKLEKGFPLIATTAAGAPMLGFLGTVTGMVRAFFDMANAGTNVDVTLLSGGIYEALVTTVGGLVVGIITLFAYNYLVSQVDNVVNKMEARTMEFMDLLNEPAN